MVFIFSRPYFSTKPSKHWNTSLSRSTSCNGVMAAAIGVNSTQSANRMLAAGYSSAIVLGLALSASEIGFGKILSNSIGTLLEEIPPIDKIVEQAERN